jgi:hypothetical protein
MKAAVHKLARLIYTMLTKGAEYVDRGQDYYEQQYRQRIVANLHRKAVALGLKLTSAEVEAETNQTLSLLISKVAVVIERGRSEANRLEALDRHLERHAGAIDAHRILDGACAR